MRSAPKSFRWRSPTGAWTLKRGIPNSLYRIYDAIDGDRIYLPEGEKAVDVLLDRERACSVPPMRGREVVTHGPSC